MALFKGALMSRRSYCEEDSSIESLVGIGSPDATTISSSSNPSSLGDEHSKLRAHTKQLIHDTANGHAEFVALQRELARFVSKSRGTRTNVLRLSLLPFVRRRLCEILPVDQELQFRVRVLESWWIQLLRDLQSNLVSGADRAAYYETISGLLSRPEWQGNFNGLILETLNVVMPKISLPNLPGTLAAFAGKLLAYAFLNVAGVADSILFSLRVQQQAIDRLVSRHPPGKFTGFVPDHLRHLVACTTAPTVRPPAPFRDAYSAWIRNWFPDSGIFVSFLKHYYSLLADALPADYDDDMHLAAPGLVLIQASIVQFLDGFVAQRREPGPMGASTSPGSPAVSPAGSPAGSPAVSPAGSPAGSPSGSPSASPMVSPRNSPPQSPTRTPSRSPLMAAVAAPNSPPPAAVPAKRPVTPSRISSLRGRLPSTREDKELPALPKVDGLDLGAPSLNNLDFSLAPLEDPAQPPAQSPGPPSGSPNGPQPTASPALGPALGCATGSVPTETSDPAAPSTRAPPLPFTPPRRPSPPRVQAPRVDRLRIFCALREILHNDQSSVPYYQPFCLQFDRIIQTVASSVNVYYMNSCVKLCDFVEEWLNCVTIDHRRSLHQVTVMLPTAVDWEFWLHVAGRMLTSESCHTEIRAMSLLFNIWPHIPFHKPGCSERNLFNTPELCQGYKRGVAFTPRSQHLLADVTEWLLSQQMWNRYFLHWSPLVRSYYHRLVCFRVAGVGSFARQWVLDYDTIEYHLRSNELVKKRLLDTYLRCSDLAEYAHQMPCTVPSQPLANRFLSIGVNAAANQPDSHRVYMFDIFDNSAYYSDKRSTSQQHKRQSTASFTFDSGSSTCSRESQSDTVSVSSSASYLRRVSSLSSMPSIQESVGSKSSFGGSIYGASPGGSSSSLAGSKDGIPVPPPASVPSRSPSDSRLAAPSTSKRWSLLRKLLPTTSTQSQDSTRKSSRPKKKHHRFADPNNIPAPWQLSEPCPEVQRPIYRFNLGPVNDVPVLHEEDVISVPFMPFESELEPPRGPQRRNSSRPQEDLGYWNYGCRALAEWNGIAGLFEQFVDRQRGFQPGDKLAMPFMVAEIPWRAVG